jgi:hypothetical protein
MSSVKCATVGNAEISVCELVHTKSQGPASDVHRRSGGVILRRDEWEPQPPPRDIARGPRFTRDVVRPRAISDMDLSVAFLVGWKQIKAASGRAALLALVAGV